MRVMKGGSADVAPEFIRFSMRGNQVPANSSYIFGFRLVRESVRQRKRAAAAVKPDASAGLFFDSQNDIDFGAIRKRLHREVPGFDFLEASQLI